MPIYEYKCPSCRKVFEEWVKARDTAPQPCPDCGTASPHIVSHTTFVLKGGGWYVTEYGNRKQAEKPSSSGAEKGTPAAAAGSDAPAAGNKDAAPPLAVETAGKDAAASAA